MAERSPPRPSPPRVDVARRAEARAESGTLGEGGAEQRASEKAKGGSPRRGSASGEAAERGAEIDPRGVWGSSIKSLAPAAAASAAAALEKPPPPQPKPKQAGASVLERLLPGSQQVVLPTPPVAAEGGAV